MFGLIKKMFMLLTSIVSTSHLTNCISLSERKCMTQPIINLHPNEYSKELHYYLFSIK